MRPSGIPSALFAAWVCASQPAWAGGAPAATLEVRRTPEAEACIAGPQLLKTVEARLRRSVFARSGTAPLALDVALSRREASWVASVRIADQLGPLGERELSSEAPHCSALDDSLALVVALLVDTPPARPVAAETPPETPSPSAESRSAPAPERPRAASPLVLPRETVAPREPIRVGARGAGALAFGVLPGVAAGAELAASLHFPRGARVRAAGEAYLERDASIGSGSAAGGAEVRVLRAGLELCGFAFGPARPSFELCAGQRLGRVAVQGVGFDQNLDAAKLSASIDAGLDARFPLTRDFAVVVAARGELPLSRDRFTGRTADGESVLIFQPSLFGAVVKMGLEVGQ